jgi:gliding motility-associated-like protein
MRYYLLFAFMAVSFFLNAQNLVPNPGFDDIVICPEFEENDIVVEGVAPPWVSANYYIGSFDNSSLNVNGPLIYNECATLEYFNVPNAGFSYGSYQEPRSGGGYGYLLLYSDWPGVNRTYLEAPLLEILKPSKQYYIELYASPNVNVLVERPAIDGIGVAFSDTLVFEYLYENDQILSSLPVIHNQGFIIKDTVNWARVSGKYTAKGNEKFIILGNFIPNEQVLIYEYAVNNPKTAHYYIEDVLVALFDPLKDTLFLCNNEAQTFNAGFYDATYLWSNGTTDSIIQIISPGIYTVQAFMENCIMTDTMVVIDPEIYPTNQPDTSLCVDQVLVLQAPLPGEYLWSTGSTESKITPLTSGDYAVTVSTDCGEYMYQTTVEIKDCQCKVFVPNAFSPNDDGINDVFAPFVGCDYDFHFTTFQVFDRWGNLVFESNNGDQSGWDGFYRGKPSPSGTYAWVFRYEVAQLGVIKSYTNSGDVNVTR